jgi:hypothetical protein
MRCGLNRIAKTNLAIVGIALVAASFNGCTRVGNKTKEKFRNVVLQVVHAPYVMTMYPRYSTKGNSYLHLDIRKNGKVEDDAHVSARLVARDGDTDSVEFKQDANLRIYFASIRLKHDEDYVVETDVRLKDKTTLHPIFSFHCGDQIPHVEDDTEHSGAKE